jgi:hypothetical protein
MDFCFGFVGQLGWRSSGVFSGEGTSIKPRRVKVLDPGFRGDDAVIGCALYTPVIKTIVFPLYSRTGLRTAPSVAHLDSLGSAPLGLFSALVTKIN